MNIIEISIENIWTVKITFNWLLIILTIILVIFLDKIWKWLKNKTKSLNEITILDNKANQLEPFNKNSKL